jgi:diamine N-acetyltransferase
MTVTLRPLTRDNLFAVLRLKLHPGQEEFVADNAVSIANAYVEPTFVPLGVYAGDELVGFAMYGQHPDTGAWWVIRLMIDRAHQGKGYGRAAMEAVIAMMAERVGCEEIVTSFNPANTAAANLYASLGFQPTGEIEDDEPLVLLRLADRCSDRDPSWTSMMDPHNFDRWPRTAQARAL